MAEIGRLSLNSWSFCNWICGFTIALIDLKYITSRTFDIMFFTSLVMMIVQVFFTGELCILYRHMPYRSIGCFGKTMVDVITVCAPLVLRHVVPFEFGCLLSLVGFIGYLLTLGQILHIAADISYWDVLLGIVMQILVYLTGNNLYVCSAVLVFCSIVIFYRYLSYEAPITSDDDVKKDLEDGPNITDDDVKKDSGDRPNMTNDDVKKDLEDRPNMADDDVKKNFGDRPNMADVA